MSEEDWADKLARKWLDEWAWFREEAGKRSAESLATLLREVAESEYGPYIGFEQHMKDKALDRADLLAKIKRGVGLEVRSLRRCSIVPHYRMALRELHWAILDRLERFK